MEKNSFLPALSTLALHRAVVVLNNLKTPEVLSYAALCFQSEKVNLKQAALRKDSDLPLDKGMVDFGMQSLCACLWAVTLLAGAPGAVGPSGLSSTLRSCRAAAGIEAVVFSCGVSVEPASFHGDEIKARCCVKCNEEQ